MTNTWFRFHRKVVHNHKVQTLEPYLFKMWVNLMCLADDKGKLPELDAVSYALHETNEAVSSAFHTLVGATLLVTDGETFHIAKWDKKQYKSDTSTERVKRWRNAQRNASETAQKQNRTETEQIPPNPLKGEGLNGSKRVGKSRRKRDQPSGAEIAERMDREEAERKESGHE